MKPRKSEIPPEAYAAYLENGYRRNLLANAADEAFFNCATNIVSITVVLPAFLKSLNASNFLIGLLPCVNLVGAFVPQLFASYYIERLFRKKPFVLVLGVLQRLPYITLGVAVPFLLPAHPGLVLRLFFITFSIAWVATGFLAPAWAEMMAKAIPQGLRGNFFGIVNAVACGMAVIGGFVVKAIMEGGRFRYPDNYAALFIIALALFIVSWVAFLMNREPVFYQEHPAHGLGRYLKESLAILKTHHNFARLIAAYALIQSSIMATAFYMVYAMKKFSLTDAVTGNFVLASTAGMVAASLVLGKLADLKGHRLNLLFVAAANVITPLAAVSAGRIWHMYGVFALMSAGAAAALISVNNLIFELAPGEKRPTYIGLLTTLTAPFVLVYSISAGKLADISYHLPFYISSFLNLAALFLLVRFIKDPRHIR